MRREHPFLLVIGIPRDLIRAAFKFICLPHSPETSIYVEFRVNLADISQETLGY